MTVDRPDGPASRTRSDPSRGRPAMVRPDQGRTEQGRPDRREGDEVWRRLQRAAGNAAVSRVVSGGRSPATVSVQRHSSWEHALLGDTPPAQLADAAVPRGSRAHVLASEWERMTFFSADPHRDPRARFPDIRWIQLRTSKLWVSYGELNALGDYLPGPNADTLDLDTILPVLQRMRSGIRGITGAEFGLHDDTEVNRASGSPLPGSAGELQDLDAATASLGVDRYAGLVARNACHFAPFSWQRWSLYHQQAREEALRHFAVRTEVAPIKDLDLSAEEHLRQAVLNGGYADHFLQDSFAAGHLVNKTLVMQWFVDYLNGLSWAARPWFGLPDAEVLAAMGSAQQPGIAGLDRYGKEPAAGTDAGDRILGDEPIDPQTAQERTTAQGRLAGSGVVAGGGRTAWQNYQAYLRFLNSGFLQRAGGLAHDWFNEHGLMVTNPMGATLRVGGDETLLSRSGPLGALMAAEAAQLSRTAVDELARYGRTDISVEKIFQLVPQAVLVEGKAVPLAEWQQSVLRDLCWNTIFPGLISTLSTGTVIRAFGGTMVESGLSVDSGRPGPVAMGDFPMPASGSAAV